MCGTVFGGLGVKSFGVQVFPMIQCLMLSLKYSGRLARISKFDRFT